MRTLVLTVAVTLATTAAAHADRQLTGSAETVTHDCATDPVVVVAGSTNQLTTTGTCTTITIQGSSNTLTIAAASTINVQGSSNQLTIGQVDKLRLQGVSNQVAYKGPLKAKKTKVSKQGVGNKVTKVK